MILQLVKKARLNTTGRPSIRLLKHVAFTFTKDKDGNLQRGLLTG